MSYKGSYKTNVNVLSILLTLSGILQKSCTQLLSYRNPRYDELLTTPCNILETTTACIWDETLVILFNKHHMQFSWLVCFLPQRFIWSIHPSFSCKALLIWLLSWFEFYFGFHLKSVEENTRSNVVKHQKYIF